jgi:hypothetical protein
MPQQEAKPFWNSQQLRELLRQQMEMFRRTAKLEPRQLEDQEIDRTKVVGPERLSGTTALDSCSCSSSPAAKTKT